MSEGQTAGNLTELFPGWWVTQSHLYHTNSGLFTSEGAAVLIDPGIYPDEIERLASFVSERRLALQAILLTHSHWDHLLGAERFAGIPVLAHQIFYKTAVRSEPLIRREIAAMEKEADLIRRRAFRLPCPEITFDTSLTLQVGRETLELYAVPGHAPDQFAIYQPGRAILWAADMLSDLEIPLVQSSLRDYMKTMCWLDDLPIRGLIPGHGSASGAIDEIEARLSSDRAYLAELDARARQAVGQGLSMFETIQRCEDIPFRQDRVENSVAHQRNVEAAYIEAGGRAPEDSGWTRTA